MTRKSFIALSIAAVLASGAAFAAAQSDDAPAPQPPPPHGMKLDKNGDGVVDKAEAAASPRLAADFDALDANKDGKLSADELQAARGPRGERGPGRHGGHPGPGPHDGMQKLDADKDGRISRAEAAADPKFAARFDRMDVNKDGYVDRADFQARMQQRQDECFAKADADGNGQLSRAEFAKVHEACRTPMPPRGPKGGPAGGPDDGDAPPPPPPAH